jgi:hypothetical protein
MPNVEFIARNGIVSRGNLVVSGSVISTSPASFSGSLSLTGDLNFQPGASGATRFISMSASPTEAAGNNIVIKAGDATASGNGGSITLSEGLGSVGGVRGTINMGTSGYTTVNLGGGININNSGPNTGTSLTVNGGGQTAMRFDWDNINLVTSAVSANRILRFTGASQYQVRGSGTTSSTTSFLVQNSAAGEAFKITDDRTTTISGTQTNLSTSNVYVGALSLTSAGVGVTGQGIWSTGTDGQMVLAGSLGGFVIKSWTNGTIALLNTVNPRNLFSIQQYGFSDGNTTGLTGNTMNIAPIYNFTGVQSSATVRGIYYNPTLTSLVNTNHIAIETTTGNVLLGTTSGNVGIRTTSPSSTLDVSGSGNFTNNLTVTGSLTVITGSSIEFQVNQTGVKIGNAATDSHSISGSVSISGSAGTGSALYAYKSGSTVLDIQGSQGQLFSVIDALSGSLMSVNDISGLPIVEVFSDDRVVMGTYGAPAVIISGSNTVISGSLRGRVVTLSTASATASMDCSLSNFFDLTLSGSMYLTPTNILPGETINLRITQPATSGSLNYTSSIKFPNGLPYTASATSSVVDLVSFISFDSSTLYATAIKNLV